VILQPLVEDDLEVLSGFFASPHVERWWHQDPSLEAVHAAYLPYLTGSDPTVILLAIVGQRPVGLGQWYLWDDNPQARDAYGIPSGTVGLDYLIGHAHDCGRGMGTQLLEALVEAAPDVPIWVTPEEANEPSCRVLEKCGFELMAVKQCQIEEEPWAGPTALYRLLR